MQRRAHETAPSTGNRLAWGEKLVLAACIGLLTGFVTQTRGGRYPPAPDFASLTIEQKKRTFFAFLSPMIAEVNFELAADRDRVIELREALARGKQPGWIDRRWLASLADRLEVPMAELTLAEALEMLERRAGVVPEALVLSQAAIESGWGTSRFALEGNNYFGQRCYEPECGMRPLERVEGSRFGLARFPSVAASVESYILNLNTHQEYRQFRRLRQTIREAGEPITGLALVDGLSGYSERGADYVDAVTVMIRANDLE